MKYSEESAQTHGQLCPIFFQPSGLEKSNKNYLNNLLLDFVEWF